MAPSNAALTLHTRLVRPLAARQVHKVQAGVRAGAVDAVHAVHNNGQHLRARELSQREATGNTGCSTSKFAHTAALIVLTRGLCYRTW